MELFLKQFRAGSSFWEATHVKTQALRKSVFLIRFAQGLGFDNCGFPETTPSPTQLEKSQKIFFHIIAVEQIMFEC